MFEEYDVVILRRKKLDIPVPVGSRGTIVHVLDAGSGEFLVEFPGAVDQNGRDANGDETLGVYAVHDMDLDPWKDPRKHR